MWPLIKLLPITTNFRFVAFSRIAAVISVIAVIGSLAMVLIPFQPPCGGLACGIDFKGGTLLEISTAPKAVDLGAVRQTLEAARMGDVQVQAFGSETSAMVRFQTPDGAHPADTVASVKAELTKVLGQVAFTKTDVVGGVNSSTSEETGLEIIRQVYPKFGLVPGLIIAPGWSQDATVAAALQVPRVGA